MKRRWLLLLELLLLAALGVWVVLSLTDRGEHPKESVAVKIQLRGATDRAYLYRQDDGAFRYLIQDNDGHEETLTPEQLSERLYKTQVQRGWLSSILNISSPMGILWVTIGLLGQVLFTGRMIVQWLISEKEKRSVVPPIFWWMSLIGSSMLLIYFLWRKDPVGLLGQAFGWFIYVRNLWMIYSGNKSPNVGQDPGPEPELAEK